MREGGWRYKEIEGGENHQWKSHGVVLSEPWCHKTCPNYTERRGREMTWREELKSRGRESTGRTSCSTLTWKRARNLSASFLAATAKRRRRLDHCIAAVLNLPNAVAL